MSDKRANADVNPFAPSPLERRKKVKELIAQTVLGAVAV